MQRPTKPDLNLVRTNASFKVLSFLNHGGYQYPNGYHACHITITSLAQVQLGSFVACHSQSFYPSFLSASIL